MKPQFLIKQLMCSIVCCLLLTLSYSTAEATKKGSKHKPETPRKQVRYPLCIPCDTSSDCFKPGHCDEADCQDMIVNCHQITETIYNTMVAGYQPGYCTSYTVREINTLIGNLDCKAGQCLQVSDGNTNGDILITPRVRKRGLDYRYSIPFLKGLIRNFTLVDGDIMEICKAVNCNGDTTGALKVIKISGLTPVYYGDLTELYP